jgi:hypothetical protein
MDVYIRSGTYISPMFAVCSMIQRTSSSLTVGQFNVRDAFFGHDTKHDPLEGICSEDLDRVNPKYTDEHRRQWRENPETLLKHRKETMDALNLLFSQGLTTSGSEIGKQLRGVINEATKRRLGTGWSLDR